MVGFGAATAVEHAGEGRYETVLDAGYGMAEALNGGYLMAVLGRAAVAASPHAHPVSTAVNFHRVARPGPARVLVEPRKEGRTAATSRVTLVQDDRPTA
ncbi:MAG: acyl-CoA thioesterase domain-containing protein, partial [Actinomycetes bacterium]